MRTIALAILTLLVTTWTTSAQTRRLDVHLHDGTVDTFALATLDSAVFGNGNMTLVTRSGPTLSIELDRIDSLSFPFAGGPAVSVLAPTTGARVRVGDTLVIQWRINPLAVSRGVSIVLTPDDGDCWGYLTGRAIANNDPCYDGTLGTYRWTVGATIACGTSAPVSAISAACRIRVLEYGSEGDPERSCDSPTFEIAR